MQVLFERHIFGPYSKKLARNEGIILEGKKNSDGWGLIGLDSAAPETKTCKRETFGRFWLDCRHIENEAQT